MESTEFRIRVRRADTFKNKLFGLKSFNRLVLDDGISATYGEQKNHQGFYKIQSIIFDAEKHTATSAKSWYLKHKESIKKAIPIQLVSSNTFGVLHNLN